MNEVYHVDIQATAAYKDIYTQPCDCVYCRNFRKTFASECPQAFEVLRGFGLELDSALDIIDYSWNATGDRREYYAYFSVKGTLEKDGLIIHRGDAKITLFQLDSPDLVYANTGMEAPCFVAEVRTELPWRIEERPQD